MLSLTPGIFSPLLKRELIAQILVWEKGVPPLFLAPQAPFFPN